MRSMKKDFILTASTARGNMIEGKSVGFGTGLSIGTAIVGGVGLSMLACIALAEAGYFSFAMTMFTAIAIASIFAYALIYQQRNECYAMCRESLYQADQYRALYLKEKKRKYE
jgi:hypothetical protein